MKLSGALPNLINGVSQQPPALRLTSQLDLQENCYSTVVGGLTKRPPTNRIARLWYAEGGPFVSPRHIVQTHIINRDEHERYIVIFTREPDGGGHLRVWDFQGREREVHYPDGRDYLSDLWRTEDLKIMTVADYSFVLNRLRHVRYDGYRAEERPKEALLHIIQGNYGKRYEVTINGQRAAIYDTPGGEFVTEGQHVGTAHIADRLMRGQTGQPTEVGTAGPGFSQGFEYHGFTPENGWHYYRFENAIHLYRLDGQDFTVQITDDFGGRAAAVIKSKVQDFSTLPNFAPAGFVCEIEGAPSNEADNYWVQFHRHDNEGRVGGGVWVECAKPGTQLRLDPSTMPHVLIRNGDGTFTFQRQRWDDRQSGSDEVTPGPSFIDRTLNDVFFFKNRLGFLSDENAVMSRAGSFWDFFQLTATALLDDDPIDVGTSHTQVSILRHAVPFQDRLMLFSAGTQFVLSGGDILTPRTVSIQPQTEFESSPLAAPTSSGRNVFFSVRRGGYTMLREYQLNDDGTIGQAEDVTSHVPQYVPRDVTDILASTHEDLLIASSRSDPSALYVYKWFISGDQKLQSSWSRWQFPEASYIWASAFIESSLYIVVQRSDELALERIDLQSGLADEGSNFVVHLDRKAPLVGNRSYNSNSDTTTVTTPYGTIGDIRVVTRAENGTKEGLPVEVLNVSGGNHILLRGRHLSEPLWIGTLYTSRARLSTIFVRKTEDGGGQRSLTEGRLQLLTGHLQYSDTGYLRVEVTPQARPTNAYVMNGRRIGDPTNIVGETVLNDGSFRFPILSKNDRTTIDIVNDSYLPMAVSSLEWIGSYNSKARRY